MSAIKTVIVLGAMAHMASDRSYIVAFQFEDVTLDVAEDADPPVPRVGFHGWVGGLLGWVDCPHCF